MTQETRTFLQKLLLISRKEPVALAAGAVITVLVAFGVSYGVIDDSGASLILAGASLVLGVPLTWKVRSKVTPQINIPGVASVYTDAAIAQVRDHAIEVGGEPAGQLVDAISDEVNSYLGKHRKS